MVIANLNLDGALTMKQPPLLRIQGMKRLFLAAAGIITVACVVRHFLGDRFTASASSEFESILGVLGELIPSVRLAPIFYGEPDLCLDYN